MQFFTGSVGGQLTSFNYLDGLNPIMIRNLLYSVCIRAEKGKDDPVIRTKCLSITVGQVKKKILCT